MKILFKLIPAGLLATALSAQAATVIPVANGDFEANGSGQASGWDGDARAVTHSGFPRSNPSLFTLGDNFVFNQNSRPAAEQTITTPIVEGDYTLSGIISYGGNDNTSLIAELGYDSGAGFVQLGTGTFGGDNNSAWEAFSLNVPVASGDAGIGEDIIIRLASNSSNGVWFDNIALEVDAVPEPSSALLCGLAGIALLRRRRA